MKGTAHGKSNGTLFSTETEINACTYFALGHLKEELEDEENRVLAIFHM